MALRSWSRLSQAVVQEESRRENQELLFELGLPHANVLLPRASAEQLACDHSCRLRSRTPWGALEVCVTCQLKLWYLPTARTGEASSSAAASLQPSPAPPLRAFPKVSYCVQCRGPCVRQHNVEDRLWRACAVRLMVPNRDMGTVVGQRMLPPPPLPRQPVPEVAAHPFPAAQSQPLELEWQPQQPQSLPQPQPQQQQSSAACAAPAAQPPPDQPGRASHAGGSSEQELELEREFQARVLESTEEYRGAREMNIRSWEAEQMADGRRRQAAAAERAGESELRPLGCSGLPVKAPPLVRPTQQWWWTGVGAP